ncbi:Coenzyme PQQ synthesis protein D (PqqD) [Clostridiales bacterium CHKCI001]|nr:Coenzyme PQQ synthesis protein D (PqqD) [Clostridiales bacterium CHKCI001]
MYVSKDFIVREIAGDYIVVPTGEEALKFNGLITLNEVGAFLWKKLEKDIELEALAEAVCEEYEVEEEIALSDVKEFLQILRDHQMLLEQKVK